MLHTSPIRRLADNLDAANAAARHFLWRRTLAERLERADRWEASASTVQGRCAAVIWRDVCWGSVAVRGLTSCPRGDRALGTGHNAGNDRGASVDVGSLQSDITRRVGGSEAAVLAVRLGLAAARVSVSVVVGAITAVGAVGGAVRGVLRLPCALYVGAQARQGVARASRQEAEVPGTLSPSRRSQVL